MLDCDVVIAGAGLGGLCAAAGLRRAGLRVLVFERDAGLTSRRQGYRININPAGHAALRACLPDSHFALYRDTSHCQTDASVDIFSTDLQSLLLHRMGANSQPGPPPSAVDRATLRTILLDAAGEVRFGCEVLDATTSDDSAAVHISDSTTVRTGLVVAADGARSTLRQRFLPGHDPAPLGTVGIYGRAPLDPARLTWLPRGVIHQRFVGVTDAAGTTLALGVWYPHRPPAEAAREHAPGLELPTLAPYIMWVLLCPADAAPSRDAGPEQLHRFALSATSAWADAATQFIRDAIVPDTFRITLRAKATVPSWAAGRVTFLGDAIHAMSPAGGEGANTALADAASLVAHLQAHPFDGLAAYERDLRERAQQALDRSANFGRADAQEVTRHV